jgi:predicted transglutaminase-like cysteine proteinase
MIDYATLKDVNAAINDLPYTAGVDPLWEPIDLDADGGTCSNFAVAKYRALRARGWDKESLILTCAFVEPSAAPEKRDRYHAILVVKHEGKLLAMDNRKPYPTEVEFLPYEWHKLWSHALNNWEWAEGADRAFS